MRELLRHCAPPLDEVIERAKHDLAQEVASEARAKQAHQALLRRRKLKSVGGVVKVLNGTGSRDHDGRKAAEPDKGGSFKSDSQGNVSSQSNDVRERKASRENLVRTLVSEVRTFSCSIPDEIGRAHV